MFPLHRTAQAGFTLIELIMAIAIMAILMTVAAPSLRDVVARVRLTGQANELLTALTYARSEATKRDAKIAVCARKKNEMACTEGQQWDNGWLVVIDADSNGDKDDDTVPLKVSEPLTGSNTIKHTGKGPKGSIIYTATGVVSTGPAIFTLCDPSDPQPGRTITVAATGRASVSTITSGCK
jgi:type IV fimbrial biogenesis protein FimT